MLGFQNVHQTERGFLARDIFPVIPVTGPISGIGVYSGAGLRDNLLILSSQFVFNLSQVTSAITSGSARISPSGAAKKRPEIDVFCHESFLNTLSRFQRSENIKLFDHLADVKFGPKFQDIQWIYAKDVDIKFTTDKSVKQNDFYISVDKKNIGSFSNWGNSLNSWSLISSDDYKKPRGKQGKLLAHLENELVKQSNTQWKDNFTPNENFERNKKAWTYSGEAGRRAFSIKKGLWTNHGTLRTPFQDALAIQNRGFRTRRSLEEEKEKSKGLFSGLGKINEVPPMENPSLVKSNKYLEVVEDESLSAQDKIRLKISFAEGYMVAANEYKKGGQATLHSKLVAITKYFITATLVVIGLALLLLNGRKTLFSINLGHHGEVDPEEVGVTFDDVKGVEEVKEELQEIVEFLKNPNKFSSMGGKLPRGVLLVGPPGTGKTLLAKAVAGEANVPFFHVSGSEFDEIFVGEGARRVRNLFKSAKAKAPAIIFIDEIDCVGSKRKSTMLHPYANQTINQLLSEMDGFAKNEGVIILGATNRKSDLDSALLRPGRFDVEVLVPLPDLESREQILELYVSRILSKDIDIKTIAQATPGCTGADLEAMINHAAIRAASEGASYVTMEHIENAKDKIIMGPERKSALKSNDAKLMTAYHEGGHTLVAYFTEGAGHLNKVTIVPRGESLGHTAVIPEVDSLHVTKAMCLARLDVVLGGRAAEELIFGPNNITMNASDDLEKATKLATDMVKRYGMSEKIGLRTLKSTNGDFVSVNPHGQAVTDQVDVEVKRIVQESYERAKNILRKHAKEHKLLAEALVKYKTLSPEDIRAILGEKSGEKGTGAGIPAVN